MPESGTTSTVVGERLFNTPWSQNVETRIARYGYEYEMLPRHEPDDGDYDPWDPHHDQCNCDSCLDNRRESWREDQPAHGEEVEDLIRHLGPLAYQDIHSYHCSCNRCNNISRTDPIMNTQEDSTVGIEFISRILDYTPDGLEEINRWVDAMRSWSNRGGWMPDGYESCGNHVHVGCERIHTATRERAHDHIRAVHAAYCWDDVADGGCGQMRGYNSKPSKTSSHGGWSAAKGYDNTRTIEHRLWNTPLDPQRLHAHIGISIAVTRWAVALAIHDPEFTFWDTPTTFGNHGISDSTWETMQDQLDDFKTAVVKYIPDWAPPIVKETFDLLTTS